jgi:hypothetical protein
MNIFVIESTYPAGSRATPTDHGPRSIPSRILEFWIENFSPVTGTASRSTFVDFGALRQRIKDTANLPLGWDSGSAGPMSNEAIQNAISLVKALESAPILPSTIIPTCDDSLLIRYHKLLNGSFSATVIMFACKSSLMARNLIWKYARTKLATIFEFADGRSSLRRIKDSRAPSHGGSEARSAI